MISPPDSVLCINIIVDFHFHLIWFLFVICNCSWAKSLDLLGAGKLGDPGEHKIKRRQSYREKHDLSSDEEFTFVKTFTTIVLERNQLHILTDGGKFKKGGKKFQEKMCHSY